MPNIIHTLMPAGTRIVDTRHTDRGVAEVWKIPGSKAKKYLSILRNGSDVLEMAKYIFAPGETVVVPLGYLKGKTCFYMEEQGHA